MKSLMIYTKYNKNNLKNIRKLGIEYSSVIAVLIIIISGLVIGTSSIIISENFYNLIKTLQSYSHQSIYAIFINSLLFNFSLIIFSTFFAFSSIGIPFINLIPLIYGILSGIQCGFLIMEYSTKGLIMFSVMKLPSLSITGIIVLMSTLFSVDFSKTICYSTFFNIRNAPGLKEFIMKIIKLIPICIISAIAECFLFAIFSEFINA